MKPKPPGDDPTVPTRASERRASLIDVILFLIVVVGLLLAGIEAAKGDMQTIIPLIKIGGTIVGVLLIAGLRSLLRRPRE
jgi:hypothetical protein